MFISKHYLVRQLGLWSTGILLLIAVLGTSAWATTSVILSVPNHSEEALNWCGPATGQMIMEGYPSGSCSVLQEDIWTEIQANKVESVWDTDPAGLQKAMQTLCPPSFGHWAIFSMAGAPALMYWVAYWMNTNHYPVAVVQDTDAHNPALPGHKEHWVVIKGVVTDLDPRTSLSVNLLYVLITDPSPAVLGDPPIESFLSGSMWYSRFKTVSIPGSSYQNNYVAIIEPPSKKGVALAPVQVLKGNIIPPEKASALAADWLAKNREILPFKGILDYKPLPPLLVNKNLGGYYIVPFAAGERGEAPYAVFINAYTGEFQEVGSFKPFRYLPREEAVNSAARFIDLRRAKTVEAELVTTDDSSASRYFPTWRVKTESATVLLNQRGERLIAPALTIQKPAITKPEIIREIIR